MTSTAIKKINGIPLSVNKFSQYSFRNGEIARKQERLLANNVNADEVRRWLRRIISNFELKQNVKMLVMADNQIIPWIKEFYKYQEPTRIELLIVLLHVRLCVKSDFFDTDFGLKMAKSNELRCQSTLGQ